MRRAIALAALAWAATPACSTSESEHPTITELRNGSLSGSPVPVCAGIASATLAPLGSPNSSVPGLTLIGSGFVANVNLLADDPKVYYGEAHFIGPATLDTTVTGTGVSPQSLGVGIRPSQSVPGQPLVPPGVYDFVFIDSDRGEFHLPHAVDFVLPPQISAVQPPSLCPDQDATVTLSGSGFTPGATTVGIQSIFGGTLREIPATATASSVVVTVPAGTLIPDASNPFFVKDSSGCTSPMFPVTVTARCGP
jgi:IPT/TIG domain